MRENHVTIACNDPNLDGTGRMNEDFIADLANVLNALEPGESMTIPAAVAIRMAKPQDVEALIERVRSKAQGYWTMRKFRNRVDFVRHS